MGVIRVTTRPYYYAKLEEEKKKQIPEEPKESFGTVTLHFRVADAGFFSRRWMLPGISRRMRFL